MEVHIGKPARTRNGNTLPFPLVKKQAGSTLNKRQKSSLFPFFSWICGTLEKTRKTLESIRLTTKLACIRSVLATTEQRNQHRDVDIVTYYPSAERIIAIGDVHGDLQSLQSALRLSKVVGVGGEWTGGRTLVVQLGDVLDRGDQERQVLQYLEELNLQASRQGGRVVSLLGNHEVMNVELDFRYVTPVGFSAFTRKTNELEQGYYEKSVPRAYQEMIKQLPDFMKARALALRPGGPTTVRYFSKSPVVLVVGDNVFVHAGLNNEHVDFGLDEINNSTTNWLLGKADKPDILRGRFSPVWTRIYSYPNLALDSEECHELCSTLDKIPAKRMIVGHTPQSHINAACKARVWRVDTGLSTAYGGNIETLEITRKGVKVLKWKSRQANVR
ncbi:hypothetical protein GpartN1_g5245.t1 [Galdieria partita]|uniref:Calcineurin-like phosphoesterase domain-containing protein n=1 Tax=Galdieria partita TaxID=83374 RepID=A0A9C7PZJ8_9RHOD|nr:hypothetical protein GpartN1_g956.t1 [Galdieria partita]GJQ13454.1 hypothetical protein GpartN1_g5245.t1 [Galdieria partita]